MRQLYWIASAIILFFIACTKIESTTIGTGLIPPIDGVTTLDTVLDVYTQNYIDPKSDSLRVYKTDDHVIGVINNDPLFGKTTASAFFELKPTFYKYFFQNKSTIDVDSAVLILSYKGAYGDTITNQNWVVREVTETMKSDSSYTVSSSFATGSVLGSKTIDITSANDSVNYGFENAKNQIRIKLSSAFANRIIKQFDTTGTGDAGAFRSDSAFRQSFKGFAVMPAAGSQGNALLRVNLLDTNTKLALFYNYARTDTPTKREAAVNYFRFSTGAATTISGSANNIQRQYSGSQLANFTNNGSVNDTLSFLQTAPGTFTTIKIPGLSALPNVIIHRAELTALQAPDLNNLNTILTPPAFLLLSGYDSTNKVKTNVRNDFYISNGIPSITTFGGYPAEKAVPDFGVVTAYTFDLSRYVQGIVTRKDANQTLMLSAPTNDSIKYAEPYPSTATAATFYINPNVANIVGFGRVRLGGGGMYKDHPLRMRMRIIYSRI